MQPCLCPLMPTALPSRLSEQPTADSRSFAAEELQQDVLQQKSCNSIPHQQQLPQLTCMACLQKLVTDFTSGSADGEQVSSRLAGLAAPGFHHEFVYQVRLGHSLPEWAGG